MNNQAAQTMPETLKAIADNIDRLAFSLPAPNEVTPQLVGQAIHLRTFAAALSQTAGVPDGWMRDVADAAASLDKRGDRQMAARLMRLHRDMLAAAPAASGGECPTLHPATEDLIRRFSDALREKLSAAEKKYGYSDGWASPDWMDQCRRHLDQHVAKGDPRDVAAYCAFLWHHGEPTTKRDRDADRKRFPDDDFNAWLDAGISDAGHTVYDSLSSIEDAWQGWHGHVLSVMIDENPVFDDLAIDCPPSTASVSERAREEIAVSLWHRWGDEQRITWDDEPEKVAFLDAADEAISIVQALTQQRGSVPEGMLLVPRWKMNHVANMLDRDGDEHGVSADIRSMIESSPAITTPQPGAEALRDVPGNDPRVDDDSFTAAVRACRSQLGALRPNDDEPEEQWMWDKLTKLESLLGRGG